MVFINLEAVGEEEGGRLETRGLGVVWEQLCGKVARGGKGNELKT